MIINHMQRMCVNTKCFSFRLSILQQRALFWGGGGQNASDLRPRGTDIAGGLKSLWHGHVYRSLHDLLW